LDDYLDERIAYFTRHITRRRSEIQAAERWLPWLGPSAVLVFTATLGLFVPIGVGLIGKQLTVPQRADYPIIGCFVLASLLEGIRVVLTYAKIPATGAPETPPHRPVHALGKRIARFVRALRREPRRSSDVWDRLTSALALEAECRELDFVRWCQGRPLAHFVGQISFLLGSLILLALANALPYP
jgi:hypothetical protein